MLIRQCKIALGQIFCLAGDREGNFRRIENAVMEAKTKQADIILLPETSLFGWVNPEAHKRAFPIPGEDSDRLCTLAKKYKIHIAIGLCENENDKLYDSALLIDDEGTILLKHRKINILTELMTPPYTSGENLSIANTKFGKIGLMICADSFRSDLLGQMMELQPDFMLIPYGWAAPEEAWPQHGKELQKVVQNVAKVLQCPVIGTDLVGQITTGPWKGQVFGGQSIACNEKGEVIGRGKDRDRDILIVNI